MAENNKVFCQLRVSMEGSKRQSVYNGIRANDWLSPIGIKQGRQVDKEGHTGTGIVVESLTKRPYTANSIIIIRPTYKSHGLQKYEAIKGNQLSLESDTLIRNLIQKKATCTSRSMNSSSQSQGHPINNRIMPVTADISDELKRKNKGILIKSRGNYCVTKFEKERNSELDLTIESLQCCREQSRKSYSRFSERTDNSSERKGSHKCDIDTIEGIKRSYGQRAQSAPVGAVRFNTKREAIRVDKTDLYWRAKSAYHRKHLLDEEYKNKLNNHDLYELRGSLLRPLMFSSDGIIKHSAGCPYKCKGCFKACLVSEDYLEKTTHKGRPVSTPWRKQRLIKRGPGFSVQLALAKSQPLYEKVHGKLSDISGIKEAWVD